MTHFPGRKAHTLCGRHAGAFSDAPDCRVCLAANAALEARQVLAHLRASASAGDPEAKAELRKRGLSWKKGRIQDKEPEWKLCRCGCGQLTIGVAFSRACAARLRRKRNVRPFDAEMSRHEVAEALGLTVEVVRSTELRALAKLRAWAEQYPLKFLKPWT